MENMQDNLFAQRASVRRFKPDAVPQADIDRLLNAAVAAPSGGNCQPWHFYVVKSAAMREKLARCAYGQSFIAQAPLVIVVCAEPQRSAARYAERGEGLYSIQDTAAAVENILLCATQSGLGACWCGAFDEAAVSETLALPKERRPVAILPVGYAAKAAKKPARRPMDEVVTVLE